MQYIISLRVMKARQIISQNLMIAGYDNLRKPNKEEDPNKEYYDRVYLCYKETNNKPPTYDPNVGVINCHKYKSFQDAENWLFIYRKEIHTLNIRYTMIPICKWVPEVFDNYILNWKLENSYWLGQGYKKCD